MRASLRSLTAEQLAAALASLPEDVALALAHDWEVSLARDSQLEPEGDWLLWLILAGRGFGKTRTGAEWIHTRVRNGARYVALVGATASDVRDVMVEGPAGVLATARPGERPVYEPSKRRVTFHTGAVATTFTADEPDRLRGPQHDTAWCDEIAAWRYADDAWSNLLFGLRLGSNPRICATTTPRATKLLRELIRDRRTTTTRGSTYENAQHLAGTFLEQIKAKYEGTRLGRQEIFAEILDDTPGALWTRACLEAAYARARPTRARRLVVAIDPSVSIAEGADEAGIVVAMLGDDGRGYVLEDLSGRLSPDEWARKAVDAYKRHSADVIVAEANNGGEMVRGTVLTVDKHAHVRLVHASRGKRIRAEPVAALYEQQKVSHVGSLAKLEDEMCTWAGMAGDPSPNRVDALVWALTELMLGGAAAELSPLQKHRAALPTTRL